MVASSSKVARHVLLFDFTGRPALPVPPPDVQEVVFSCCFGPRRVQTVTIANIAEMCLHVRRICAVETPIDRTLKVHFGEIYPVFWCNLNGSSTVSCEFNAYKVLIILRDRKKKDPKILGFHFLEDKVEAAGGGSCSFFKY